MRKTTKQIVALFFILLGTAAISQTYDSPESAEYDYANSRWLIGNTGSDEILARNSEGELSIFAENLGGSPYGIEIVDDVLYCCIGSSIKGYTLADGENVFNAAIGGGAFLNGLTHDNFGNLYTTDFSGKKIYKVHIATQTATQVASGLGQSPNGIIFDEDGNRCIFVNWGANAPVKAIDLISLEVSTLATTTLNSCDGIARDGNGNYYISAWGTQSVYRFDAQFANTPEVVATGLSSPADIFYNTIDNILAIPNSGDDTVDFLSITLGVPSFDPGSFSVKVFPNPVAANSVLDFQLNEPMKVSAEVFDIQGRSVHTVKFADDAMQSGQVMISDAGLNLGVYFVVFRGGKYFKTIPIVVK